MTTLPPFALERYFAKYEFKTKFVLSASDCEPLTMKELMAMADEESLRLWDTLKLSYTETLGHPRLLEEIAHLYASVKPNQILVAAPEELIYIAMNVLLGKGDEVIVTAPAYQSLHELASSLGSKVVPWNLNVQEHGWSLDIDFLSRHITDKTKLIIINFPHNPTGHHIQSDELHAIIELARKRNCWIFSDEMYRGAEYRPEDQLPAIADEYLRGISLWGLSKSFSLPGLRIGWLASQDADFISRCSQFRDYLTICNSAPGEILALIALRSRVKILQRTRDIIRRNLAFADGFFSGHSKDFSWLKPKAGSIAFPILRKQVSVEDFCENLVMKKNLLITPASQFQFPGNHFRIGLGRDNFAEALSILESSL
ncbi:MAG TPA: aminotransferase class I/II-fold pyridoxal phosphate-dependent enzyme [Bacteroidota bacterium]